MMILFVEWSRLLVPSSNFQSKSFLEVLPIRAQEVTKLDILKEYFLPFVAFERLQKISSCICQVVGNIPAHY